MLPIPADIFTEPEDVSPDSLANLGPLRRLAGTWQADKGIDINPKAEGPERRTFIERIRMDPIDPQANGPQLLYGLRYHIHINTPEEDITFNDDGSWTYLIQTELFVRGAPFNHHDSNTLQLVAPPKLNPLAVIVKDRAKDDRNKGSGPA